LDLQTWTYITAQGLGALLRLRGELMANGVRLKLCNLQPLVSEVFEVTRLNQVFGLGALSQRV
jgi:anti-anti-sigma factor